MNLSSLNTACWLGDPRVRLPPPDPPDYIKLHHILSGVRGMWLSNKPLGPERRHSWHTLTCSLISTHTKWTQAGTHVSHYGWFLWEVPGKVRAMQMERELHFDYQELDASEGWMRKARVGGGCLVSHRNLKLVGSYLTSTWISFDSRSEGEETPVRLKQTILEEASFKF